MSKQVLVNVGDVVETVLPFSEVCMHMKVAGKRAKVKIVVPEGQRHPLSAQIMYKDETNFSFPIGLGEAGFYTARKDVYYYPDEQDKNAPWIGERQAGYLVQLIMLEGPLLYLAAEETIIGTSPVKENGHVFRDVATAISILHQIVVVGALGGIHSAHVIPTEGN